MIPIITTVAQMLGAGLMCQGPRPVLLTQFILIASSSTEKLCPHFVGEETKEWKVPGDPGVLQFVSGEARTEPCILFVCRGPGREPVRKGDQACLITESEFLSSCQAASLIRRISLIMEFPIIEINL